MGLPQITEGGLGWSDAPNHAFDGIFLLEFFRQWPVDHIREWAEQFYLRFPTLGIIVYYPPGFAIVEAAMFAMFGVNIIAARATVLLFGIGAGWMMYLLGRRWFDQLTGLFAGLLLITSPHGFLWLNDVMLEWPATFWMLAAIYAYQRDRDMMQTRWMLAFSVAITMAFMTKQTSGFILPVLLAHAALDRAPRRYWLRPALLFSLGLAVSIIGGYVVVSKRFTALPSQLLKPDIDFTFYARHLPEIVGWPLLPVAALGLLTLLWQRDRAISWLLLLWFLAWAVFSSVITGKEPRYFFFALPPLMFAAVRFMQNSAHFSRRLAWIFDRPRLVLLALLVLVQGSSARISDTGRLPRYVTAVQDLVNRPDADLVLIDAVRDGQFMFDLYQTPAARNKILPLRASKMLYARSSRERYSYQQFVHSEADILALLDRYGIRYILIESTLPNTPYVEADPPPRKLLRSLLASDPRFKLLKAWPLPCGDPAWNDVELRLYAYPTCPTRTSKTIRLSIPAMNKEVTLDLP